MSKFAFKDHFTLYRSIYLAAAVTFLLFVGAFFVAHIRKDRQIAISAWPTTTATITRSVVEEQLQASDSHVGSFLIAILHLEYRIGNETHSIPVQLRWKRRTEKDYAKLLDVNQTLEIRYNPESHEDVSLYPLIYSD